MKNTVLWRSAILREYVRRKCLNAIYKQGNIYFVL